MAAPVLQDYQFWFGLPNEDGKLFGLETNVDVISVEGLESLNIRSGTREFPRNDGSVPGLHLVASKVPIFELDILGDADYYDLIRVLTVENEEGELHWKLPYTNQAFMRARVISRTDKRDGFTTNGVPITVAFEIANPRIYGVELKQASLFVHSTPDEGLDFGIDWGVDFVVVGVGGTDIICHNAGNSNAYPIIRFYGPISGTCTGVLLQNLTTGHDLEITAAITAGQILTADMDARIRGMGTRIIDLSGASRYGDWELPRETFFLQPGDNVIRLDLTGGTSTDVQAIINWRDTSYEGV